MHHLVRFYSVKLFMSNRRITWPSCERRAGSGYECLVFSPFAAVTRFQPVPGRTPEEAPNLGDPAEWSGLLTLPRLSATGGRPPQEGRVPGRSGLSSSGNSGGEPICGLSDSTAPAAESLVRRASRWHSTAATPPPGVTLPVTVSSGTTRTEALLVFLAPAERV